LKTKIVYEDAKLLVIHKPAGLATQSARVGEADVVSELKNFLAKKKEGTYVGVIHRLDQPVEGLLVFAKDKGTAAALTKQLGQGSLHKWYKALVYGTVQEPNKRVVSYLEKQGNVALVADRKEDLQDGKEAVLTYDRIWQRSEYAYLDICIETGRFHQIRAQLSHIGLPILGDSKYGTENSVAYSKEQGKRYVCLCADKLSLTHPASGKNLSFCIEPAFLQQVE